MIYYFPIPKHIPAMCDTRNFFGNAAGCKLFLSERDSDISICVEWEGHRWHFPAHKLILCTMSEVFQTMFRTNMLESSNGVLTIRDNSPLTVKQFLKYLYIGCLDFNGWIEAADLLKIAHKYGVFTLVALCEAHLTTSISFSNSCYLHELAQTYSLGNLRKDASNFIQDMAFIVTATEGFCGLRPKSLEFFLSSTKLNMENECCVLSTLKEWAIIECCRRGLSLLRENVLSIMEPFLQHVKWDVVPEELRTFVPEYMIEKYAGQSTRRRKSFYVPPSLQHHVNVIKFVVELGAFNEVKSSREITCLKFGVDGHAFVAGFRIVGMFKANSGNSFVGASSLTLGRDDNRSYTQFNLNSLPWTKGYTVDEHVWRELTAYLPYPVRIDPFGTYVMKLKYSSTTEIIHTKWPITRLENAAILTDCGPVNFHSYSSCYGITQLFLLPAPPVRNFCSDTSSY